jgi:hypothetical protein
MKEPTQIISTIRLTEKASLLGERHNQYVFRVATDANKIEIKNAIEKLFGKRPLLHILDGAFLLFMMIVVLIMYVPGPLAERGG